jgi:hypothetical protein
VVRAALPSLSKVITHEISCILLVNGAAIEASASDKLIPASAYFKAAQSFAPSPHIPTIFPVLSYISITNVALSSGDILAYTCALSSILFNTPSYLSLFLKMNDKALPFKATLNSLSNLFSISQGT